MPTILHPGVYLEEIPSGAKTIEGVSTSIAAFVGPAHRGPAGEPVLIHSLDDYISTFGGVAAEDDAMGLSVTAFYLNGGKDAYIARLVNTDPPAAPDDPQAAPSSFPAVAESADGTTAGPEVLKVSASSVGTWGDSLRIRIKKANRPDLTFTLEVGHLQNDKLTLDESFPGLSMNAASADYALTRVNGISKLVTVSLIAAADPDDPANQYQRGSWTGAALPDAADFFSTGFKDAMTMSVNVDGLGAKKIKPVKPPDLGGANNAEDGGKVAAAIQRAVSDLGPAQTPYRDFTCAYTGGQFVLTSGSKSSSSSVVVYGGDGTATDLAKLLKLDPESKPTAVVGAAKVVPAALSGRNDLGVPLTGGKEGPPKASDYTAFFDQKLAKIRDVSILVLPGKTSPRNGFGEVAAAIAHCEAMRNRMVIVDPDRDFALATAGDVDRLQLNPSTYGVLYYPWVEVSNPFFTPGGTRPATVPVAPSAFAAAMWAKIDGRRGVWKAPAGVETSLLGVAALAADVGDGQQDQLNPLGVNALRKLPGFGPVIWGTRTLSTQAAPEWRYVPVRRTAIFLEQSIYNGIQFAVFEPNDHKLWASLRSTIDSFLNGLWRAGAFQGEKASDAYFVRCGLGDTMTQGDIDRGQVIAVVGFAPLKPAEFVIVRIQQLVGQQ